jgi:hypothetical protein
LIAICTLPPFQVTVTVPLRAAVDAFDATTSVSVPLSLPEAAPVKVTQLAFDVALQVQLPDTFVTVISNVPPPAAGDWDVDDTVYPHVAGEVGDSFLLHADATRAARHINTSGRFIRS